MIIKYRRYGERREYTLNPAQAVEVAAQGSPDLICQIVGRLLEELPLSDEAVLRILDLPGARVLR